MNNEKTSSSDIVEAYRELDSISAVANKLHVSEVKVRRTLITEGLWSSRTSRQVSALLTQGASVPEIANQLNTTIKAVEAYMPYRRGAYDESSPSSSSERSEAYRQRKEAAAKNQIHYSGDSINSIATKEEKKALPEPTAQQLYTSIMEKPPKVMRLRLELSGVGESEKQILRTYGQVKNTVSRENLVPAEITLHALHYCIQRAFGWQNSHPHHFEYPDQIQWKLLDTVSDASNAIPLYRTWEKLCGVYYRFPLKDEKDIYWDDDYDGNESIKSWLRK